MKLGAPEAATAPATAVGLRTLLRACSLRCPHLASPAGSVKVWKSLSELEREWLLRRACWNLPKPGDSGGFALARPLLSAARPAWGLGDRILALEALYSHQISCAVTSSAAWSSVRDQAAIRQLHPTFQPRAARSQPKAATQRAS